MQVLCGQREALRPQYLVYEEHIHRRLGSRKNPVPCVARCPAVELLRQIGDRDLPDFHGKQVQVIGGGNVAMDAALRSADYLVTGENPDPDAFTAARGKKHRKEAIFSVPGAGEVRVAVASRLGKTRKLMKSLESGRNRYDFVEVMACPGGCAGGGQPIHDGGELSGTRGDALWKLDQKATIQFSHENPEIQTLCREFLERPLGRKSHHLLHTDHTVWEIAGDTRPDL